jgi:hypothetical protein
MQERKQTGFGDQQKPSVERAVQVDLSDFAEALTSGVIRALDRRAVAGITEDNIRLWRPWIWAGWIMGPDGPNGPISEGPLGGGPFGDSERPGDRP